MNLSNLRRRVPSKLLDSVHCSYIRKCSFIEGNRQFDLFKTFGYIDSAAVANFIPFSPSYVLKISELPSNIRVYYIEYYKEIDDVKSKK